VRILHTSDWHLGISTGPASRAEEQGAFLDWLLDTLKTREIDVLVVAGDLFDSMHPSAEAQALYYRFLARVAGTGVRDVVVVGGNHDSPSRLDAPRALLKAVAVHVVGGVPATDDRLDRMIAPLRARGSDEPAAVCLAVPYVHEYRLGIRTSDLDLAATRAAFQAAFSDLYRSLADQARARFGDLPLVATGHLTMGLGAKREDYPQEIHQVGTIEGLPTELLDPRIRYAALGHIHRCYPVEGSTAWYSGTPLPYTLSEMRTARQVLVVQLDGATEATVQRIEVPRSRDLVQLVGPPEVVLAELAGLTWSTTLPPLVHVRVQTQLAEPGLARRLHEAVASHERDDRPVLVEVKQRASEVEREGPLTAVPPLLELTPTDVFGLICDARKLHGDERQHLEAAFGQVASADRETLDAMLAAIELPPTAQGEAP
jgi:DNA repair protein SbcD/Mre11